VVAHRASTVLLADKVALLDTVDGAGTITHIGTHAELLASVPRYRFLLAADDELDDGCEVRCDWEDDDERRRLGRAYEEACEERAVRRSADYARSEGGQR
jgi:ATP-binding cassette subfamily B protein